MPTTIDLLGLIQLHRQNLALVRSVPTKDASWLHLTTSYSMISTTENSSAHRPFFFNEEREKTYGNYLTLCTDHLQTGRPKACEWPSAEVIRAHEATPKTKYNSYYFILILLANSTSAASIIPLSLLAQRCCGVGQNQRMTGGWACYAGQVRLKYRRATVTERVNMRLLSRIEERCRNCTQRKEKPKT